MVALYTSAWIEIIWLNTMSKKRMVALYTSAWIEMTAMPAIRLMPCMSHSTRVRGLKYLITMIKYFTKVVALYTSAWIEIPKAAFMGSTPNVALYTSAWIEMAAVCAMSIAISMVALLVSAWIEIGFQPCIPLVPDCRTPRECVD